MRFLSANAFQLFFHYTLFFPNITDSWGPHTKRNREQHAQVACSLLFCVSDCEAGYTAASLCFMLFIVIFQLLFPFSASFLPLPLFCPLMRAILL